MHYIKINIGSVHAESTPCDLTLGVMGANNVLTIFKALYSVAGIRD